MRLAICDDDEREISALREQLSAYQRQHGTESIVYKAFSDPKQLLEEWKKQEYDVAVLDIMMPGMDGITLGTEIKKQWPETIVIYLTSSTDFALDAYGIHAERYIIKPTTKEKLFEALDYALKAKNKGSRFFSVKTANGVMVIKHEQILFIEMSARKMVVHLTDGQDITSIYLRSTFSDTISELLDTNYFVLTHKSFLANMSYIKSYSSTNLILQVDKNAPEVYVPISRQHTGSVKQSYLQFMARGRED
jgi:DNA-binding LytR/AlgR family response regulator